MTVLSQFLSRAIKTSAFLDRWGRGDDVDGDLTPAGVRVTRETAMQLSAVWACVSLISETISMLPLAAVTLENGIPRPLSRQPRWIEEPNPEQERHQWIGQQLVSLLFDGTTYIHTIRDDSGDVLEAWVAPPWMVTPRRVRRGRIEYQVSDPAIGMVTLNELEMFHIPAMSWPGKIRGMSPLEAARRIFGLGLGAQEFAERYYGQGFHAAGIVETLEDITPEQARDLKKDFGRMNSGLRKAHLPAVLTNGAKWKPSTVSPEQAQFLETRGFTTAEIARFFRCPPHRIGDVERSTSWGSGLEEENIAFVMFTLGSWLGRLQQGYSRRMMVFGQEARAVARFDPRELTRGGFKTRMEGYAIGRNWGLLNADDANAMEGWSPLPDGLGQEYLVPMNMRPAGQPAADPGEPDE